MKTAAMGEVKIDRSAIAALSSDGPLTVSLTKGGKVVGTVQAVDQKAMVTTDATDCREHNRCTVLR